MAEWRDRIPIYVAGAYSDNDVIPILDNMRRGMQWCYKIVKAGPFAPWCPWMDYHYSLIGPMTKTEYYEIGLAWLRKSEGIYVIPDWEDSVGTRAEIDEAKYLAMPVMFDMAALDDWGRNFDWSDRREG